MVDVRDLWTYPMKKKLLTKKILELYFFVLKQELWKIFKLTKNGEKKEELIGNSLEIKCPDISQ
jgi:hypothetical protein